MITAHVNKIILEDKNTEHSDIRATGVLFEYGGKVHTVHARRDVILSAGALKTPQLLELSGIGRGNVLAKIGVPLRVELPGVGENVQEHIFAQLSYELKEDVKFDTLDLLRDPVLAAKHLELHAAGSGIHTSGIIGFAFATMGQVTPKAREIYQSIRHIIDTTDFSSSPASLKEQYEILAERFDPDSEKASPGCEFISFPGYLSHPNPPEPGKRYITFFAAANHMLSRGTIHCTSADPTVDPEFDPRTLMVVADMDVLVEMCKFTRKAANTAPFKDMYGEYNGPVRKERRSTITSTVKELNPGVEVQTDKQWREWLKTSFSTTWHTSSSCSMLPRKKDGVVDANLKVYGTQNLRVVDLSVIPLQIAAHPQSMVYGIAEQAADIIKGKFTG
ncbi:hypothetical protein EIP86_000401 [Pleurotus ostreatoroseus]|nr:hypothetical protein EIP86_000401 [Pleurotus ostreatoroseus]